MKVLFTLNSTLPSCVSLYWIVWLCDARHFHSISTWCNAVLPNVSLELEVCVALFLSFRSTCPAREMWWVQVEATPWWRSFPLARFGWWSGKCTRLKPFGWCTMENTIHASWTGLWMGCCECQRSTQCRVIIYLFLYLANNSLNRGSQDKVMRVLGDIALPSPAPFSICKKEYRECVSRTSRSIPFCLIQTAGSTAVVFLQCPTNG